MKTRLEDLIQKASVAQPPEQLSRSNWTPYLPIVRILMEERAHTLMAAVEWLVGQGEIPQKRQGMAYRSLRQILARREAKRLRKQVDLQRQLQAHLPGGRAHSAGPRATVAATAARQQQPSPGLLRSLATLAGGARAPVPVDAGICAEACAVPAVLPKEKAAPPAKQQPRGRRSCQRPESGEKASVHASADSGADAATGTAPSNTNPDSTAADATPAALV